MRAATAFIVCSLGAHGLARADVVTHFGDGVGPSVGPFLDQVGIGADNAASENTLTRFTIPGAAGTPQELTFRLEGELGGFQFVFGYARLGGNPFDPITQRQQWATEALSAANATIVFDDRVDDPPNTSPPLVELGGEEIAFFIIPNNTLDAFRADPGAFYADVTGQGDGDDALRSPLFSISDANPGERDQMFSFAGNQVTMLAFEDLIRTGFSDSSFTDLIISVNREILPSPGTGAAFAVLGVGALRRRRR